MHIPKFDFHFTAQGFAVYRKRAWRPQMNRLLEYVALWQTSIH